MRDIVEELKEGNLYHALHKSHDNPIGLFWYNLDSGELEYDQFKAGMYHGNTPGYAKNYSNPMVLRGRVFKDGKKTYVMLYAQDFKSQDIVRSKIHDVVNKVSDESGSLITRIVDEGGRDLTEAKTWEYIKETYSESLLDLASELQENVNSEYKLSSTQIYLPNELAEEILKFTLSIADEDLYTEDDKGRELEVHTTIKYGLNTTNPKAVESKVKDYDGKDIKGKLKDVTLFEEDDQPFDVVKIDVESEDLNTLHELLGELDNEDTYPDYKAHCTIAYVKKGKGKKYVGKKGFSGKTFSVDCFYFCSSTGDKVKIELKPAVTESLLEDVVSEIRSEGFSLDDHIERNKEYQWLDKFDGDYIRIQYSKVLVGFKVGIQSYVPKSANDRPGGYIVTLQRNNMPIKTSAVLPNMSRARQVVELYKREAENKYAHRITEKILKTDADFENFVYNPQEAGKPKSQLMADFYVLNSLPSSVAGVDVIIPQYKTPTEEPYPSQIGQEEAEELYGANDDTEETPKEPPEETPSNESILEAVSQPLAKIVLRSQLKCYNYLKDHMTETVYFSLSCESRHFVGRSGIEKVAEECGQLSNYLKYEKIAQSISKSDKISDGAYAQSSKVVKSIWGANNIEFVKFCFEAFKDPNQTEYPREFMKHWDTKATSSNGVTYSDNKTEPNAVVTTQDIKFEPGNGFYGNLPAGTKGTLVKYDYPPLQAWADHYKAIDSGNIAQKWGTSESVLVEEEDNDYPPAPPEEDEDEGSSTLTNPDSTKEAPLEMETVDFKDVTFDVDFGDYGVKTVKGSDVKPAQPRFEITSDTSTPESNKTYLKWGGGVGGNAWAKIAEAWLELDKTEYNDAKNLFMNIDHVYDLQHNNDTVFTKIKEYAEGGGYDWIRDALEFKYYANTPQLLQRCSPSLREFASYVYEQDQDTDLDKEVEHATAKTLVVDNSYVYNGPAGTINYQDEDNNNLVYNYGPGDTIRVAHKYNDRVMVNFQGYKDPNKKKRVEMTVPYEQITPHSVSNSAQQSPQSNANFSKFKLGDKVKYNGGKTEYKGQIGTISSIESNGVTVTFPDGFTYPSAYATSLEKVGSAPTPTPVPNGKEMFFQKSSGNIIHYKVTPNSGLVFSVVKPDGEFYKKDEPSMYNSLADVQEEEATLKPITSQEAFKLSSGALGSPDSDTSNFKGIQVDSTTNATSATQELKASDYSIGEKVEIVSVPMTSKSSLMGMTGVVVKRFKNTNKLRVKLDQTGQHVTWYAKRFKSLTNPSKTPPTQDTKDTSGTATSGLQDFYSVYTSPNGTQWFQHYKYDPKGDVWSMHSAGFDDDHNNVQSPTEDWKVMGASQGKTYEDLKATALKNNYKEISGALFNKVFSSKKYIDPSSDPYSPDATTATTPTIGSNNIDNSLKVGDYVTITEPGNGWSNNKPIATQLGLTKYNGQSQMAVVEKATKDGHKFKVIAIGPNAISGYTVCGVEDVDTGIQYLYDKKALEKVSSSTGLDFKKEEPTGKDQPEVKGINGFNKGDKVVVNDNAVAKSLVGKEGTIVAIDTGIKSSMGVDFGGELYWFEPSKIDLVINKQPNPAKLTIDDKVEAIKELEAITKGKIYKVEDINTDFNGVPTQLWVTNDESTGKWYPPSLFKKVSGYEATEDAVYIKKGGNELIKYYMKDGVIKYQSYAMDGTPLTSGTFSNSQYSKDGLPGIVAYWKGQGEQVSKVEAEAIIGKNTSNEEKWFQKPEVWGSVNGMSVHHFWVQDDNLHMEIWNNKETPGKFELVTPDKIVPYSWDSLEKFDEYSITPEVGRALVEEGSPKTNTDAAIGAKANLIGTQVKIVSGSNVGITGKFLKITKPEMQGIVQSSTGELYAAELDEIEPLSGSGKKSSKALQAGDKAECINAHRKALTVGKVYDVIEKDKWGFIKVINDKGVKKAYTPAKNFKKVSGGTSETPTQSTGPFKVGDKATYEIDGGAIIPVTIKALAHGGTNNYLVGYADGKWAEDHGQIGKSFYVFPSEFHKLIKMDNPGETHNADLTPKTQDFKVGDSVALNINHKGPGVFLSSGSVGVVTKYLNSSLVEVDFGDGTKAGINVLDIDKIKDQPKEQPQDFKVGDIIKIKSDASHYANQVGKITGLGEDSVGKIATIKLDTLNGQVQMYTHAIEPFVGGQDTSFEVGDTVKIVKPQKGYTGTTSAPGKDYVGETGVVKAIGNSKWGPFVELDIDGKYGKNHVGVYFGEIEKVDTIEKSSDIKVGDSVKTTTGSNAYTGKVGVVKELLPTQYDKPAAKIDFAGVPGQGLLYLSDLEVVDNATPEEPEEEYFTVGDHVIYGGYAPELEDKKGIIAKKNLDQIFIQWEDGSTGWYSEIDDIHFDTEYYANHPDESGAVDNTPEEQKVGGQDYKEPIDQTETPKEDLDTEDSSTPKFQEGDEVKILKGKYMGQEGLITHVDSLGQLLVQFDPSSEEILFNSLNVKKV